MRTGAFVGENRRVDRPLPRRWAALAWAAAWALVAGAVYWSAVRTSWGQRLDDGLLERWHSDDLVVRLVATAVRSWIPLALVVVVARLCRVAWRAGQQRVVATVGLVLLATVVLSVLLRDVLLTRPDLGGEGMPDNTLPSNHMAFTTALAVAVAVLRRCGARWSGPRQVDGARPDRAVPDSAALDGAGLDGAGLDGATAGRAGAERKVAALLAVLLVLEAVVNVTTYAHRPADMVAGFAAAMMLWSAALATSPGLALGARVSAAEADPAQTCAACSETGDAPSAQG